MFSWSTIWVFRIFLGMFIGMVFFGHGGFGVVLGVIGLAYFLNIAKRVQEKEGKNSYLILEVYSNGLLITLKKISDEFA